MEETTQTIETTVSQLIENQEVINNLFQSVEQIRTILFFSMVVGVCTFVIYLILKPLKIIMNGGWI